MKGTLSIVVVLVVVCIGIVTAGSGNKGVPLTLSQTDINTLITLHNSVRSVSNLTSSGKVSLPAPANGKDLTSITWDSALTNIWGSGYENNCVFAHTNGTYRNSAGGKGTNYVGENLAWYSNYASLTNQFSLWYGEHKDYSFHPLSNGDFGSGVPQTGHYTQLIWGGSGTVGCSYNNCTGTSLGGYLLACDYYSGGNYIGNTPYTCTGTVQQCASLGLACGSTYTDYCGTPSGSTYPTTTCSCSSGTTLSSTSAPSTTSTAVPSTTPTRAPASQSSSASSVASQSLAPSSSNTAAPSSSNTAAPSTTSTGAPSSSSVASGSNTPAPSTTNTASGTTVASQSPTSVPSVSAGASLSVSSAPSQSNSAAAPSTTRTAAPSTTNTAGPSTTSTNTAAPSASKTAAPSTTTTAAPPASKTSLPSTTNTGSPAPSKVCDTCLSLGNLTCGTYTTNCGTSLTCGTCATGTTCLTGFCKPSGCNPACASPSQTCSSNGQCVCSLGYTKTITGRCENLPALSNAFPFIPDVNSTPSYWVAQTSYLGNPPEMNNVDFSGAGTRRTLLWNNSASFASPSNTTVSGSFYAGSTTVQFGIAQLYNQGSGRLTDSMEWRFNVSGSTVTPVWFWYYHANQYIQGSLASTTWVPNAWNNISVTSVMRSDANTAWYININGVRYNQYWYAQTSYYPTIGDIYFSGTGPFAMRTLSISTATTLTVSILGCMTDSDWASFVARILGTTKVTILQSSANSGCPTSKKRQAEGVSVFTFMIEDGPAGESSTGLATQFISMAESSDPVFEAQGISVQSVAIVPETATDTLSPATLAIAPTLVAGTGVATTAGGLSTGAIIGIIVGAVGGTLLITAALGIVVVVGVVVAVVVIRKKRSETYHGSYDDNNNNIAMEPSTSAPKKKNEGVDIFDPVDRRKSVTGRSNNV